MKIRYSAIFLFCLCQVLFCLTVQAGKVRTAVFEGKPCINPPHVVGNYPASPFLFYIPTSGERPMKWHAENLPEGLKLDKKTGDRKSTRLNSSHTAESRMPSSA